jgi:hypothetical protein
VGRSNGAAPGQITKVQSSYTPPQQRPLHAPPDLVCRKPPRTPTVTMSFFLLEKEIRMGPKGMRLFVCGRGGRCAFRVIDMHVSALLHCRCAHRLTVQGPHLIFWLFARAFPSLTGNGRERSHTQTLIWPRLVVFTFYWTRTVGSSWGR